MNQNAQLAALGVVGVVLAYALLKHFKPGTTKKPVSVPALSQEPATFKQPTAITPNTGFGYDPANPGDYITNKDLINGTIADYYTGQRAGYDTPTVDELSNSVLTDIYSVEPRATMPYVMSNPDYINYGG